jgi:hypothetical protein
MTAVGVVTAEIADWAGVPGVWDGEGTAETGGVGVGVGVGVNIGDGTGEACTGCC